MFWETRQGLELSETLIRELPKISGSKKASQMAYTLSCSEDDETVKSAICDGDATYIGSYINSEGKTVVVLVLKEG